MWVHIAQIISRRTSKTRHSIQFQFIALFCFPFCSTTERWLTCFCWQIFINLRQFKRQFALIQHIRHTFFVIYREWFAPITLTTKDSITQAVVHFHLTKTLFCNIFLHLRNSLFHLQTIQESRVTNHTLFCIIALFANICTFDKWNNWQIKMASKCVVTTIVSRHSHNCTCTITC